MIAVGRDHERARSSGVRIVDMGAGIEQGRRRLEVPMPGGEQDGRRAAVRHQEIAGAVGVPRRVLELLPHRRSRMDIGAACQQRAHNRRLPLIDRPHERRLTMHVLGGIDVGAVIDQQRDGLTLPLRPAVIRASPEASPRPDRRRHPAACRRWPHRRSGWRASGVAPSSLARLTSAPARTSSSVAVQVRPVNRPPATPSRHRPAAAHSRPRRSAARGRSIAPLRTASVSDAPESAATAVPARAPRSGKRRPSSATGDGGNG